MERVKYEWEKGVERGDQVRIWTKVMPFWWAIIRWLVGEGLWYVPLSVLRQLERVVPSYFDPLFEDI